MGQKTTNKTVVPDPTPEERRLTGIAGKLGEEQLSAIQEYSPYREMLFSMIPGLGKSISRDLGIRGAEFRNVTPEEREYRQFLNTAPPGASGGGLSEKNFRNGFTDQDWFTKPLDFAGENSALGSPGLGQLYAQADKKSKSSKRKRQAQADAANAAATAEQRRQVAAWEAKRDELKGKMEAARAPTQNLGLDDMSEQDAYDYGFSPFEYDLVNDLADDQYAIGASDIDTAYKESLGTLAQELAPARGLRGYDAPILDRGGKLAMENVRQKSQLTRGLRAQSSQQLLGISEQAKANRMNLLGFLGNQGLGLGTGDALGAAKNLQNARLGQAGTSGSASGLSTGDAASIASGVGSLVYAFSSKDIKDVETKVSGTGILNKLRAMNIYRWNYKGDTTKHIGPMAEDFKAAFGVGDGKTLALVDVMGVLLAAMQGLAEAQHG